MKLSEIKLGKLNVLDIAILGVIVLFIGIFAVNKLGDTNENVVESASTSTNFSYTITIESLSDTSADMFRVGDEVYDKVSNVYIGKISSLEINDAIGLIDKDNGEIVEATVPGKIDVKLDI